MHAYTFPNLSPNGRDNHESCIICGGLWRRTEETMNPGTGKSEPKGTIRVLGYTNGAIWKGTTAPRGFGMDLMRLV